MPRDPIGLVFGEPEIAVAAGDDFAGAVPFGQPELGQRAVRTKPPDAIAGVLGEPQIAVRAGGDAGRPAVANGAA